LILVTIDIERVGHANDTVVYVQVPVVTQLFLPLKVVYACNLSANAEETFKADTEKPKYDVTVA